MGQTMVIGPKSSLKKLQVIFFFFKSADTEVSEKNVNKRNCIILQ